MIVSAAGAVAFLSTTKERSVVVTVPDAAVPLEYDRDALRFRYSPALTMTRTEEPLGVQVELRSKSSPAIHIACLAALDAETAETSELALDMRSEKLSLGDRLSMDPVRRRIGTLAAEGFRYTYRKDGRTHITEAYGLSSGAGAIGIRLAYDSADELLAVELFREFVDSFTFVPGAEMLKPSSAAQATTLYDDGGIRFRYAPELSPEPTKLAMGSMLHLRSKRSPHVAILRLVGAGRESLADHLRRMVEDHLGASGQKPPRQDALRQRIGKVDRDGVRLTYQGEGSSHVADIYVVESDGSLAGLLFERDSPDEQLAIDLFREFQATFEITHARKPTAP